MMVRAGVDDRAMLSASGVNVHAVFAIVFAIGAGLAGFAGVVARWAIWIFAIIVALSQLGIATAYFQTLFTGVIVALSLA